MRANPTGNAARLLDIVTRNPGISLDALVESTGVERHTAAAALSRFRRAGHVSSDVIDGHLCYWLERRPTETARDRVLARLQRGPATWRELRDVSADGLSSIMNALTERGLVRVEERTRQKPGGRTVTAPSLYHLASGPTIVAGGKGSPG